MIILLVVCYSEGAGGSPGDESETPAVCRNSAFVSPVAPIDPLHRKDRQASGGASEDGPRKINGRQAGKYFIHSPPFLRAIQEKTYPVESCVQIGRKFPEFIQERLCRPDHDHGVPETTCLMQRSCMISCRLLVKGMNTIERRIL